MMVRLTIDGKQIRVQKGMTILEAARQHHIKIPTLCYLEGVSEIGSCRLCVVEIEGCDELRASCKTAVEDGMIVHTKSDKVMAARKTVLNLIMSNHKISCLSCEKNGAANYSYIVVSTGSTIPAMRVTGSRLRNLL